MIDADIEPTTEVNWTLLEAELPGNYRDLAQEYQLIREQPAQLNTKVSDISQVLRLVFYQVAHNASLRTTTAMAAAAGIINLSAVALHLWMRRLGEYLAALLRLMTDSERTFAAEQWGGYDVIATDGSAVVRPGDTGTTARVHYALRLTTLRPVDIIVTDPSVGEHFERFTASIAPGQLWIGDRGYANSRCIATVADAGADVLVRHNVGSLPLFDDKGRRVDELKFARNRAKVHSAVGLDVWVHPRGHEPIRGKLYIQKLPADKAEEARHKLISTRKEAGERHPSEQALEVAGYRMLFTTVPPERLDGDLVMSLYMLRWQIELHIKRDKSIAGLDRLPNFRPDTIFSWLCAKLLLTHIARKLISSQVQPAQDLQKKRPRQAA